LKWRNSRRVLFHSVAHSGEYDRASMIEIVLITRSRIDDIIEARLARVGAIWWSIIRKVIDSVHVICWLVTCLRKIGYSRCRVSHEEKEPTGSSQAGARSRSNSTGTIIADLPRCYFAIGLRYLHITVGTSNFVWYSIDELESFLNLFFFYYIIVKCVI